MARYRGNHYPGLKTARLSCIELQKVLVGAPKTLGKPPDLLPSLRPMF